MVTQPPCGRAQALPTRRTPGIGPLAAFAAALFAGQIARAQEEVWIGPNGGNWNLGVNWLDGTPPSQNGSSNLTLTFRSPGFSSGYSSGVFTLNRMVFDYTSAAPSGLFSNTEASLSFSGTDPNILLRGAGDFTIPNTVYLSSPSTNLTISGPGSGRLWITGNILQSALPQTLTIDLGNASSNYSEVRLSGASNRMSGVILKSGTLTVASDRALGSGPLKVYGGTVSFSGANLNVTNPIVLYGDAALRATTTKYGGVISSAVPGSELKIRSAITLTGASTLSGPVTLDYDDLPQLAWGAGNTLTLDGAGSLRFASAINVRAGNSLQLSANTLADNRLADTTPIHLRSGKLAYLRNSNLSDASETLGPVDGAGYSTIEAITQTAPVRLNLESLARTERGTFLFRGTNLGSQSAAGVGNIFINTPLPGLVGGGVSGPKVSIIPYAIGDTTFSDYGIGLVTYSASTGVRLLDNATEYRSSLAAASADENVLLRNVTETLNTSQTINALNLAYANIDGSGTLNIASGTLLSNAEHVGSGNKISASLAFGPAEANIFVVDRLTVAGSISGTNGLTKSGIGVLTLSAPNTFTGPLAINDGYLEFSNLNQLGPDVSPIILNGPRAGLIYAGNVPFNLSRPIEARTGLANILNRSSNDLNITVPIIGNGGLLLTSYSSRSIALPAGSTYTGTTHLNGVTVRIADDSSFGAGSTLNLGVATIILSGDWTSSRETNILSGTIDTAGFDALWNGPVTSMGGDLNIGSLTKRGVGELRLTTPSRFRGNVMVEAGTFTLADTARIAADVMVSGSGIFNIDHTHSNGASKLGDASIITLNGGTLNLIGSATTDTTENLKRLALFGQGRSDQSVNLITPGTARLRLLINDTIVPNRGLLIRASDLGGQQRVVVGGLAGNARKFVPNVFAGSPLSNTADSFVVYDPATDASGIIGLRPIKASEYTRDPVLRNLANGGPTPMNAFVLADSAITAGGAANTIENLTLASAGSISLTPDQTLTITSGQVLARSGATTISGGQLAFGTLPAAIYTSGDLTIGSSILGSGGLRKSGPGTLTLSNPVRYTGTTEIADGTLQPVNGNVFGTQTISVYPSGTFDVGANSVSLGTLMGGGTVSLQGGSLTLGGRDTFVYFSGRLTGTGQIVINGVESNANGYFTGSSDFTGDVVLNSGNLRLNNANALGSGKLIVNGGSLSSEAVAIAPDLVLNSNLSLRSVSFGPGVSVTGTKDLVVDEGATFSLTGSLNLAGAVRTRSVEDFLGTTPEGIYLSGPEGSITTPAGVRMEGSGSLSLAGDPGTSEGRLGDTTPVHLAAATFAYRNYPGVALSNEKFGSLTSSGLSRVELWTVQAGTITLRATSIDRVARGAFSFHFSSTEIGWGTGKMLFDAPPKLVGGGGFGPNVSIIPWAFGSSQGGLGLVTYDSNGVRLLAESEYTTDINAAGPSANVKLTVPASVDSSRTINSLTLGVVTLGGSSTLSITSGTVFSVTESRTSEIQTNLDFGSAEAHFLFPSSQASSLSVTGNISGNNGLTRSGPGTLALSGTNTFTGPITINEGDLLFSSAAALGLGAEPIRIHAAPKFDTTRLYYTGNSDITLSRDIVLASGTPQLGAMGTGSLNVSGEISGPGGLRIVGSGLVRLANVNSYEGATFIGGNVAIASDAAFGAGGSVELGGSKLHLEGHWTTSRNIEMNGATFDTAAFNADFQGKLEVLGIVTKIGSGRMIASNGYSYPSFQGTLNISEGSLELKNSFSGHVTGFGGTTVVLGGSIGGTLDIAGTLDAGPGIKLITADTLLLRANSTLKLSLASAVSFDQITSNKPPSLEGPIALDLELLSGWDPADFVDEFVLIKNASTLAIEMSNSSPLVYAGEPLSEGERFNTGGQEWVLSYQGGTGNDVILYAVPEPATGIALIAGLALFGLRRRRMSSEH